jgi:hypothetical protein
MHAISRFIAAALWLAVFSGCAMHDDDMTGLADHLDALGDELDGHARVIAGAGDLAHVSVLEDAHLARGRAHMDQMMGGGMMGAGMMGDADMMSAECDDHREAMRGAHDMGAVHAEEARHQDEMRRIMGDMRNQMDCEAWHMGCMMISP